ncbi:prephenate dehydratase [Phycicoccus endophyticus]|uniref:Prephenate dehydratase n=1 Tax=Phycicoccus endophyticus TaxID=1690220 RepID=A0A7G9R189_9MICO|nr:prephenate dehydratase [Phycicoccus endophyticus]NHI18865.1 prephenate dehydratase [Phycicoccus endophyticus]QNN49364.1 prephenate dehydratase [Phycicoccus endophyticus]GGL35948.1 prephenate dehydratase [Phycicoccus endophyticus]
MTPRPRRLGYLGPEGTFTSMALDAWPQAEGAQRVPFGSVDAAVAAVRAGEVDATMVPIENSVEGGVSATLDALANGDPLLVTGEVLVPVSFVLAARSGTALADVRAVGTHSHAWAQVRGWMAANLPGATYVPTLSTAAAAQTLGAVHEGRAAASGRPVFDAAVCAPAAATLHRLEVVADGIGDRTGAVTRFVLVARPGALPEPTGADKTTVVLYQRQDHAGGLLELLEQFAARGINMTRLESRPTKASMGSYCFSVDIEGHVRDERLGEALMGLRRICAEVRFLGSYPRADRQRATIAPQASDADFAAARAWLHTIRDGGV